MLTLPPEYAVSLELQPIDALVETIAGLIGTPGDPDGRALAMECLQEAADQLNAGGILMFSRKELDVPLSIVGESTFELPGDWGWPERQSAYALDSAGNQLEKLTWIPWEDFRDLGNQGSSIPRYLSIRSEADQTAYMSPAVDPDRVAALRVPYLTRIPNLIDTTQLRLSPEARHALKAWGKAFAMQHEYKDKPPLYAPFFKVAEAVTRAAWGADCRRLGSEYAAFHPDELGRLAGTTQAIPTGRVWIEI